MSNIYHICTYFDFNFLPRGLALYNSIKRYHSDFILYVLAFDGQTFTYLSDLKFDNLKPISISTYNKYFSTSQDKYEDRKQYYFSATPNICLYVLDNYPAVDLLLYLDADVYVYNSLDPLYKELGKSSIAICSHRFHPVFNLLSKNYGRFNVGVNLFRNDKVGRRCLLEWKAECDSWYPNQPGYPLKFFSDQIFLDSWCNRYPEITVIKNIGVDAAPWNISNYKVKSENGQYYLNNSPLIIYHFSSLKKIDSRTWNGNTIFYFASIKGALLEMYKNYIFDVESHGLNNSCVTTLTHTNSFIKRIFYFFGKLFLNETIKGHS
ncbi:MAG: hypothetical protein HXX16_14870 [Bacteroidales bacterium]|nr:hypothetical protein [Bacteroidales bacterium]